MPQPTKIKARFRTRLVNRVLLLTDEAEKYQCMSITNDAEAVVKWAHENIIGFDRILYKDCEGQWDELLHSNEEFTGFGPIGETDQVKALQAIGR